MTDPTSSLERRGFLAASAAAGALGLTSSHLAAASAEHAVRIITATFLPVIAGAALPG